MYHIVDMFVLLLDTYLNYTEPSAVNGNERIFENLTLSPNPAGDETKVQFQLQHASDVTVHITATDGSTISSYPYGDLPEGDHALNLDLAGLSPGLYFLKIGAGEHTVAKALVKK